MSGSNGVTKSTTQPHVNVVRCGCGCAREQQVAPNSRSLDRRGVTLGEARDLGWRKVRGAWVSPLCAPAKASA